MSEQLAEPGNGCSVECKALEAQSKPELLRGARHTGNIRVMYAEDSIASLLLGLR